MQPTTDQKRTLILQWMQEQGYRYGESQVYNSDRSAVRTYRITMTKTVIRFQQLINNLPGPACNLLKPIPFFWITIAEAWIKDVKLWPNGRPTFPEYGIIWRGAWADLRAFKMTSSDGRLTPDVRRWLKMSPQQRCASEHMKDTLHDIEVAKRIYGKR